MTRWLRRRRRRGGVWRRDIAEQAGLELSVSPGSAENTIGLAYSLGTRLPRAHAALSQGVPDLAKVRMNDQETGFLADEQARQAVAELSGCWAGKTWGQIRERLGEIIIGIDPGAAVNRRKQAERDAMVRLYQNPDGTCALAGRGLPADEALQADAAVQARARAYKKAGLDGGMDLLRARAYLDILNGVDSRGTQPGPNGQTAGR